MNIYENIEKVYRVKGNGRFFDSEEAAQDYLKKTIVERCKFELKNAKERIKDYNDLILKTRMFAKNANADDKTLRLMWSVREQVGWLYLHDSNTDQQIRIPFALDLKTKGGMHFARECVRCFCKQKIKMLENEIRKGKAAIKDAQREYSKLQGGK